MSKWAATSTFHLVIVVAMTLTMVLSPIGNSVLHLPSHIAAAETSHHAQMGEQIEVHDHTHDDGDAEEYLPGQTHGHDPTDHSHETPSLQPLRLLSSRPKVRNWTAVAPASAEPATGYRLKRPPRMNRFI
jgi:hypothetical protein